MLFMSTVESKCLVASSFKGGIGKTTSLVTVGAYLTKKLNKKVLYVDTDPQANLTSMFDLDQKTINAHSLVKAYEHDANDKDAPWNLTPININSNVDLLPATDSLTTINNIMKQESLIAPFTIYRYLSAIKAFSKYDYILVDTHNNFGLATQASMLCADYTMIPVGASRFSMDGIRQTLIHINNMRDHIVNPMTNQTLITAKPFMIGSIVPFTTKSSHDFLKAIKDNPQFVTYFHQRELFNRANFHHNDVFKEAQGNRNQEKVINNEVIPAVKKIIAYINKDN